MPLIKLSADGAPISKIKKSGTYHSTAIALSKKARANAINVDISEVGILENNHNGCLWTESLQSCFPVVFKFKNGDIGLFHGMCVVLDRIKDLLERDDLEEIQLFEKGHVLNSGKVKQFTENLIQYYQDTNRKQPIINIQKQDHISPYGVVVCYKSSNNKPIIIIGQSSNAGNRLVERLTECTNKEDIIRPYEFEDAAERFKNAPAADRNLFFKSGQENRQALAIELQATKNKPSCTIL
ncbi:Uncharacterised protein [Legionella beliardensis]|uniref:Uncharacterized protein n=1 Tax=Legionella beliardensis TaxID=91822 RepID=A0A378I049_9GAMM|nr:hypothetical protein [Legionella beliardensis]STX28539.1 Uncharacterised protein [Legionella beliardensis]